MISKLVRWFCFSVTFGILPFVLNALLLYSKGTLPTWNLLFAKGELLLASTAIAADAVGEVIASGQNRSIAKLISGFFCVVSLFISSAWFADISSTTSLGKPPDATTVSHGSIMIFILTLIASASCKFLAA